MVAVLLRWEETQKGGQLPWGSEVPLVCQTAKSSRPVGPGNDTGYLCITTLSMNAAHGHVVACQGKALKGGEEKPRGSESQEERMARSRFLFWGFLSL